MDFACALNTCAGCTEYIICIPLKTYTRSKPYIEMFLINLNYLRSLIMHFVIPFICCWAWNVYHFAFNTEHTNIDRAQITLSPPAASTSPPAYPRERAKFAWVRWWPRYRILSPSLLHPRDRTCGHRSVKINAVPSIYCVGARFGIWVAGRMLAGTCYRTHARTHIVK